MNDHDLLVRIDERVESIHARLAAGDEILEKHGQRISRLEQWRTWIAGAVAALGLVFAIIKVVL